MSIYTSTHSEKFQQLLKYMENIRLGRDPNAGSHMMSNIVSGINKVNPTLDWSLVNAELWMLYMKPTLYQSKFCPVTK